MDGAALTLAIKTEQTLTMNNLEEICRKLIAEAKQDPACIARAASLRQKELNQSPSWVRRCVDYWSELICESDIGVDWWDAHERCWRCGAKRSLQKCHIVARQFGGGDAESNIIPLCPECHDEAPDVTDTNEMWRWIQETKPMCYGTLKLERALGVCRQRGVDLGNFCKVRFDAAMEKVGLHLMQNGTGCRIKASSYAWAIEQACVREETNGR